MSVSTPSPFVGLRAFGANDADWFFGRDRETSALVRKLQSAGFTAVVGPSGSGKSSLVRAGVVPLLRGQGWMEIITKPGTAPIDRLALALAQTHTEAHFAEARHFRYDTILRASAFGLLRIAESLTVDGQRLLLVIDQFEELFRYGDEASGARKAGMREESRAFVELLLTAASGGNGRIHVCVTMRSDFFGACSSYVGLAEAISVSQYLVPMPPRSQFELAIRNPVKKAGAEIEEALVQRLLVDVEEEQDQLPLLQHTLRRLWEHASGSPPTMREDDYVGIGKIAGSIDRKAEDIRNALGKSNAVDLTTLERVMKALTDLDIRGRATRRMQKRSELLALLRGPVFDDKTKAAVSVGETKVEASLDATKAAASLDRVLKPLTVEENSFLQLGEGEDPEVDIGHEALIGSWTRLSGPRRDFESGWLREERDDGDSWRGYVTRAREQNFLSRRECRNLSTWLKRRALGEVWSRRYGDRWSDVSAFRTRSWWHGLAWEAAGYSCAGLAALAGIAWVLRVQIAWQIHKFADIIPFGIHQVAPHVLKTEEEQLLQPLASFRECADSSMCPDMVVIPPGNFCMGSDSGLPNEQPRHDVEIRQRFAVSKYELTADQWRTCHDHGWCNADPGREHYYTRSGNYPVITLSWDDAQVYLQWLSQMTHQNYRFLSEAEWEYVARAGTTTPYYWGGEKKAGWLSQMTQQKFRFLPRIEWKDVAAAGYHWGGGEHIPERTANCAECNNSYDDTGPIPVDTFAPNRFGLYNTRGNVWEFTGDLTPGSNYEGAPSDGSARNDGSYDNERVLRGGSWSSNKESLTASYRFFTTSDVRYPGSGLRVARTLGLEPDTEPTDPQSTCAKGQSK